MAGIATSTRYIYNVQLQIDCAERKGVCVYMCVCGVRVYMCVCTCVCVCCVVHVLVLCLSPRHARAHDTTDTPLPSPVACVRASCVPAYAHTYAFPTHACLCAQQIIDRVRELNKLRACT